MTTHASRRGTRKFIYYVCRTYQRQGASACPGSRAPIAALEAAVIDQIRAIGKDPGIVRETVEAARREFKTRKPVLQEELQELEHRGPVLETERRKILDAIAKNGTKSGGLFEKLGEVEAELDRVSRRTEEVRGEIATLENEVLDEEDLRQALAAFDPIWERLTTAERARVLQLLIDEVRYNASEGEVEIVFRPGGVRAMAKEKTV